MKQIFIFISLLVFFNGLAQKAPKIQKTTDGITWNGVSLNADGAYLIELNSGILRYDVDPGRNMVYIETHTGTERKPSKKGKLLAYDTEADKVRWVKPMNYRNDNFLLVDSIPILYQNKSSTAFHWLSGESIWERQSQVMFSANNDKIAISFKPYYSTHRRILGLDVNTGKSIWEENINEEVDLEWAHFISDTAMVCIEEGLQYVNLLNGKNFFQKQKMATVKRGSGAVFLGAGILGGLFGAFIAAAIYSSSSTAPAVGNLQTAYVYHDNHLYSVHKDELRKYDMEGNIVWSTECLNYTGSPKLFVNRGDVYIIQGGSEQRADGSTKFGFSGIIQVGTSIGEVKFAKKLADQKDDQVRDYIVKDSTIVVATDSKISEYSLNDFAEMKVNDFGGRNQKLGFSKILNPPAYVESEGSYRNMSKENPNHFYTANTANQKIEFDADFEMINVVRKKYFFQPRLTLNPEITCLENEAEVVFITRDGTQIGDFAFTPEMQITGNKIADRLENRILIYPLDAILE
ncbi:MAG: hypothetical protein ABR574_07255 [Cryomorphaceae bacterium]